MKIMWQSNAPWAATGYGCQTRMFVKRIKDLGHEVGLFAFYGLEGGVLNWDGMPVYPKGYHTWGNDVAVSHARNFGAQILITLMDSWVIDPRMMTDGMKWIPWFPVDHDPLPPPVRKAVYWAHKRIVFSKFAERAVNDAEMDCYYVPHGVDTQVFSPRDRQSSREFLQWPQDKFMVGMVAANKGTPSRKSFPQAIEAFKYLHDRHPDTMLYLHTTAGIHNENGGLNLAEIVDYHGLTKDVIICDPYIEILGFPDDHMAKVYSALDVHMLPSMGEGFGIPTIEAQACGCPVIVGDWTASGELCFSGWKIDKEEGADKYWTPLGAYQWLPRIAAIDEKLEAAYRMWGNQDCRSRARDGALDYDADRVTQRYWKPVLAEIDASLE